jgi:hypothetical protein
MKTLVGLTALFCCLLVTDPAWASGAGGYPGSLADMCTPTRLQICGVTINLPGAPQGGLIPLTLPDRFMTNAVSVQCATVYGTTSFHVINPELINCAIRTCAPTNLTICENNVPITAAGTVGDVLQIPLSPDLVVMDAPSPPIVNARCALVNGEAHYVSDNADNISCNLFLCQPARLKICGSTAVINETARLGAVGRVLTESGQPVTVQCLGSGGHAPQFMVIEHACE